MRAWLIVGLLLGPVAAWAQEPNEPGQQPAQSGADRMQVLQEKALRLIRATQSLGDWDEHYEYILDATDRVFERNGWDSESDFFSLEMVREVGKIPPWRTFERFDKALGMIGDRYLLDDDQLAVLQSKVLQMNLDLFSRHSDRIMEYAMEAIETRSAGEPFTPEQIARWTELAEPVFLDVRRAMNEGTQEFMKELDPEQRELMQRDLDAANRRLLDVDRMAQRWKKGEWDPHDWGMEDDPIQNPGALRQSSSEAEIEPEPGTASEPEAAATQAESRPSVPELEPPADDAWAKYVRAFIRKYHLNAEQQQRAWLVYRDSKERDEVFLKRYDRQMKSLREKAAADPGEARQAAVRDRTEQREREVKRLFGQLKRRLERLPTRAQRKGAEPGEIGESEPLPEKPEASESETP